MTTGRSDIWKMYYNVFKEDIKIFLIGAGISVPGYMYRSAHNFFIEIIYHIGIVGAFCYFKAIKSTMTKAVKKPDNKIFYLVWVIFFARAFVANFFSKEMLFFYFILAFLSVYKGVEAENEEVLDEKKNESFATWRQY